MIFDADIVWGCAVAADRINGGYAKYDEWKYREDGDNFISRHANKTIVKNMLGLRDYSAVTEEDITVGKTLREYYKGYLLKQISGDITDFEDVVLAFAQTDTFTNKQLYAFAVISCLPADHKQTVNKNIIDRTIRESIPLLGDEGEQVIGELIIVKSTFVDNYDRYKISGRFGESFVDFWLKVGFKVGEPVKIKGRIKQHRADGSTQLNYVKLI